MVTGSATALRFDDSFTAKEAYKWHFLRRLSRPMRPSLCRVRIYDYFCPLWRPKDHKIMVQELGAVVTFWPSSAGRDLWKATCPFGCCSSSGKILRARSSLYPHIQVFEPTWIHMIEPAPGTSKWVYFPCMMKLSPYMGEEELLVLLLIPLPPPSLRLLLKAQFRLMASLRSIEVAYW